MEETLLTKVRPETLEALMSVTSDVVNEIKEAVPDSDERLRDEHYVFCLTLNLDIVQILRRKMLDELEYTNN